MDHFPEESPVKARFTLKKEERLSSKKQIDKLFSDGRSLLAYPLRVTYTEMEVPGSYPAKVGFAVSKKLFRRAVIRNLIKRRMREAYRLNKHLLSASATNSRKEIFFIFIGKTIPDHLIVEKAMRRCLTLIANRSVPSP